MNSPRISAFTLIELLVVIGIISVLASLIFGVSHSAVEEGKTAQCTGNLRELAAAENLFIADHNGHFSSSQLFKASTSTNSGIYEYLDANRTSKVFYCPDLKNYAFKPTDTERITYTVSLRTTDGDPTEYGTAVPVRVISRIAVPSRTAWAMDGSWNPGSSFFDSNLQASAANRLVFPHNKRNNVVFVDGHVEALKQADIPTSTNTTFWSGQR